MFYNDDDDNNHAAILPRTGGGRPPPGWCHAAHLEPGHHPTPPGFRIISFHIYKRQIKNISLRKLVSYLFDKKLYITIKKF